MSKVISLDLLLNLISRDIKEYRKELENRFVEILRQAVEEAPPQCQQIFENNKNQMEEINNSLHNVYKTFPKNKIRDHKAFQEFKPCLDQGQNSIQDSLNQLENADTWNDPFNQYFQLHSTIIFNLSLQNIKNIQEFSPFELNDRDEAGFKL